MGSKLARLDGYPFEVRYSQGSFVRAWVIADIAADAYVYFNSLFSGVEPNIAVIVVDEADWRSRQPYGLPFFDNGDDQIRPGIVVMPAGTGDFWTLMEKDLTEASPLSYARLRATYPDGAGGLDLQPFFDLVSIHELAHAFEVLGDLRLPAFWLSEIFANLALHAFVAKMRPKSLRTLQVLSTEGVQNRRLSARMRSEGFSTLEQLEAHYTGGDAPMSALNYVWYQYRWQRLAAKIFEGEGEDAMVRFWNCFHATNRPIVGEVSPSSLVALLGSEVSKILGRAIRDWR